MIPKGNCSEHAQTGTWLLPSVVIYFLGNKVVQIRWSHNVNTVYSKFYDLLFFEVVNAKILRFSPMNTELSVGHLKHWFHFWYLCRVCYCPQQQNKTGLVLIALSFNELIVIKWWQRMHLSLVKLGCSMETIIMDLDLLWNGFQYKIWIHWNSAESFFTLTQK